jgi:transposase
MKISVTLLPAQYQKIQLLLRETKSRVEAMRCRIILFLAQEHSALEVQQKVGCVRSSVYTTFYRFEERGVDGLRDKRLVCKPSKATAEVREQLLGYLDQVPKDYGWQRSTWTLELLSRQLHTDTQVQITPSHLRQVLKQEKCRRGRPRPALRIPVQGRRKILGDLAQLVQKSSPDEEVLYVDEADIDLNPRIGLTYMKRGQQQLVLTPGQNVKYYIAGALNARTGNILYSHGTRKNSSLFISLLEVLQKAYRRARKIHIILDNYIIHKSRQTDHALKALGGKIHLHFLPPYSPEHNPIERLWKQLHDNVTRNHQHKTMASLWED